ncbi:MAG: acetylxylan esterase [Actinobacteria bacterium]|nr:acetylxylan esterase [Actinomycetota bacterium]
MDKDASGVGAFRASCRVLRTSTDAASVVVPFENAPLARRIEAPTLISIGLRDTITPPSTVFAAYNAIDAPRISSSFRTPDMGPFRPPSQNGD